MEAEAVSTKDALRQLSSKIDTVVPAVVNKGCMTKAVGDSDIPTGTPLKRIVALDHGLAPYILSNRAYSKACREAGNNRSITSEL